MHIYTRSQKRGFILKLWRNCRLMQMNYGRSLSSHQFNQTPNVTHSAQDQTYIMKGGQAFDHCLITEHLPNVTYTLVEVCGSCGSDKGDFEGISRHKLVEGNITHLKDRPWTYFTQKQEVAPTLHSRKQPKEVNCGQKNTTAHTQDIKTCDQTHETLQLF